MSEEKVKEVCMSELEPSGWKIRESEIFHW